VIGLPTTFVRRIAEELLCREIPTDDDAIEVPTYDRIVGRADDRGEPGPRFLASRPASQEPLGRAPEQSYRDAGDASRGRHGGRRGLCFRDPAERRDDAHTVWDGNSSATALEIQPSASPDCEPVRGALSVIYITKQRVLSLTSTSKFWEGEKRGAPGLTDSIHKMPPRGPVDRVSRRAVGRARSNRRVRALGQHS
jgi:hypothetical protein